VFEQLEEFNKGRDKGNQKKEDYFLKGAKNQSYQEHKEF